MPAQDRGKFHVCKTVTNRVAADSARNTRHCRGQMAAHILRHVHTHSLTHSHRHTQARTSAHKHTHTHPVRSAITQPTDTLAQSVPSTPINLAFCRIPCLPGDSSPCSLLDSRRNAANAALLPVAAPYPSTSTAAITAALRVRVSAPSRLAMAAMRRTVRPPLWGSPLRLLLGNRG